METATAPTLSWRALAADCQLYGVDETLIRDASIEDLHRLRTRALRLLMETPPGRH